MWVETEPSRLLVEIYSFVVYCKNCRSRQLFKHRPVYRVIQPWQTASHSTLTVQVFNLKLHLCICSFIQKKKNVNLRLFCYSFFIRPVKQRVE